MFANWLLFLPEVSREWGDVRPGRVPKCTEKHKVIWKRPEVLSSQLLACLAFTMDSGRKRHVFPEGLRDAADQKFSGSYITSEPGRACNPTAEVDQAMLVTYQLTLPLLQKLGFITLLDRQAH